MFIGVHKPKTTGAGNNKGSSSTLMNYLSKEDGEVLDQVSEDFLEENEGTIEALEYEIKEYENSILELEKKISSNKKDSDNYDSSDNELLDYYKNRLTELRSNLDEIRNENIHYLDIDKDSDIKFSKEDYDNNIENLLKLNELKNDLNKEINEINFELNNKSFSDNDFKNKENLLLEKIENLKNIESKISDFEGQRDKINLQLEDKTKTFFNSNFENCNKDQAIELIDKQSKGLEKNDTKFFMLSVDPSEREIKHLLSDIVPDIDKINSTKDLTLDQREKFESKLKDYTHSVMEEYAKQFDRTKKNGEKLDRNDLVYVAKIETERKYSHKDRDVVFNRNIQKDIKVVESNSGLSEKNKLAKISELESKLKLTPSGEIIRENLQKEGFQNHVHIVVSRYDKNKEMKLSPMANSRGQNDHKVGGREVQIGFNRVDFKIKCEEKFDQQFQYDRPDKDKASLMIQDKRNQKADNLDVKKVVNKDGKVDTLEAYKMYATVLKNTGEFVLTGNAKSIDPSTLIKKFSNEINPAERLQRMLSEINPKQLAIQSIKKALTKGGLEL